MINVQTLHAPQGLSGFSQSIEVPSGMSVAEIARLVYGEHARVTAWVRAPVHCQNEWVKIPSDRWELVRPKSELRFSYRPQGDVEEFFDDVGDFVQKKIIDPVKKVFDPPTPATPSPAQINQAALSRPSTVTRTTPSAAPGVGGAKKSAAAADAFTNVDSDINLLGRDAYLPIVVGEKRISLPELAQPLPFIDKGVQSFNRIFALDGHHEITGIQVDGSPVDDFPFIKTEILPGAPDSGTATFVDKICNVRTVGEELPRFTLDERKLVSQDTPEDSEPRPIRFTTKTDPRLEEIAIRLRITGMVRSTDAEAKIRVPIRLRFRESGSIGVWVNLPEIHIIGRSSGVTLIEVRFRWDDAFGEIIEGGDLTYKFFQRVPEHTLGTLSDGSTGDMWQAATYFVDSEAESPGLRDIQHITTDRNGLRVRLDEAINPKLAYEWECIRGAAINQNTIVDDDYTIFGEVVSLFLGFADGSDWRVERDQANYLAAITVDFATSIVNQQPCQRPGTALLALQSRGQSVRNVTAIAKRVVQDWDGAGWNIETTTKNPATHYRQLLHDFLTHYGIDTSLIDNDAFVAWRQECIDRGYEVSSLFSGATTRSAFEAICVAGYARPRFSDGFGVDYFRDRSAERPVQTFSPRNAEAISIEWGRTTRPTGLRVSFQDEANGYRDEEVEVSNPFYTSFQGYDTRDYSSITKRELVIRRAIFEMLQDHHQGRRVWRVATATEGVICERGDLVGVVTDLNNDTSSGARVREVLDTTTLRLDQLIPPDSTTELFSVGNIFDIDNIFLEGAQSVCLVSTPTGTEMRNIVAADGDIIRVDSGFSTEDLLGAHIAIGPVDRFMNRCIVSDVRRVGKERSEVTLVDEAPEIWEEMAAHFNLDVTPPTDNDYAAAYVTAF